VKTTG